MAPSAEKRPQVIELRAGILEKALTRDFVSLSQKTKVPSEPEVANVLCWG